MSDYHYHMLNKKYLTFTNNLLLLSLFVFQTADYMIEKNNFNSEQFWIGLTDRNGKLNWLEDDKSLDYK